MIQLKELLLEYFSMKESYEIFIVLVQISSLWLRGIHLCVFTLNLKMRAAAVTVSLLIIF